METIEFRHTIREDMPRVIEELSELVRIPSMGYPGYDPDRVRESAETTRRILERSGVRDARLIELAGGHPAVYGDVHVGDGVPTVLLYAHHDVQPEGPVDEWDSPPFEPSVRDGRVFGRGTADDKCGIAMHAAALRAWDGAPPVNVKLLIEGEEECSTEHLPELIGGHADLLRADVAIVADSGNYRTGVPTITTSVRGVTDCVLEVRVLERAQHSGSFGGPIVDAYTALARIIASLHDERGAVAVEGLRSFPWEGFEVPEEDLREEVGAVDSLQLMGEGSISDRIWGGPAVAVLGIDGPRVHGSSNQIVPVARARVSLRLAPGDDPVEAGRRLRDHLVAHAPWGVEARIVGGDGGFEAGSGYMVDTTDRAIAAGSEALAEAYGRPVVLTGSGGSIPLVPLLADIFPGIAVLLWGASDERSNIHSTNESVDLGELERMCVAEAVLLDRLARGADPGPLLR